MEDLKYYIFDWDDNLLKMNTPLHFLHLENDKWIDKDINPEDFAVIRKKYPFNYADNEEWKAKDNCFIEFTDNGPREKDAFIEDIKKAIEDKNFGPSWEVFKEVLIKGILFAIITTRGHEPLIIRKSIDYIIQNVLSEEEKQRMIENIKSFNKIFRIKPKNIIKQYLNECYFMGLNSKAFFEEFGYIPQSDVLNKGKQDAINHFINFVRGFSAKTKLPLKVGFSDDDINFSDAAKELFMYIEKSSDIPEDFYVFDTSNPYIEGGIKIKI
jgi:hypothetical protein